MRLWSLHPKYLDSKGLVALWREALFAQAVLNGETAGYRNHPQLQRFKQCRNPKAAISLYLQSVYTEAVRRGYHFDKSKIHRTRTLIGLSVAIGQMTYEWHHLMTKLKVRSPEHYKEWRDCETIAAHPLFDIHEGEVEPWEKIG